MTIGSPKLNPRSFSAANARAIPPSGRSPEAIWHCAYDTQTYTSGTTTTQDFFTAVNTDKTLSNMEAAGQFPAPQVFQLYAITCDLWTPLGVSTSATTAGNANDLYLLLMTGRPSWLFTLQNKTYGRYPLSTLHASGGPDGFLASAIASPGSLQFARNALHGGWNYNGSITIPAQTSFQFNIVWAAAQTLTANWLLRVSLFGQLDRAVK